MNQKSIYIVLTRTSTLLSRAISCITGDMYTHASIALEENLQAMYSFGRKRCYNPLKGGFCRENLNEGIFASCQALPYAMIQIDITEEQYDKANALIEAYSQNAAYYRYNYVGLLLARIGKQYKCNQRFYCSEFIYDFLEQCKIVSEKLPPVIRPQELMQYGKIVEAGDWNLNKKRKNSSQSLFVSRPPCTTGREYIFNKNLAGR